MARLWIARDGSGELCVYQREPYLELISSVFNGDGDIMQLPHGAFPELAKFHKVKMLIGEKPIDCTPKPIPELYIWRSRTDHSLAICTGDPESSETPGTHSYWNVTETEAPPNCPFQPFKCRIAWDEKGIRFIGEPEMT